MASVLPDCVRFRVSSRLASRTATLTSVLHSIESVVADALRSYSCILSPIRLLNVLYTVVTLGLGLDNCTVYDNLCLRAAQLKPVERIHEEESGLLVN